MACYAPIQAYRTRRKTENGKAVIVFNRKEAGKAYECIELPCGKCIGCRLDKSKDWALRCVNEASLYHDNCFITLTYDEQNIDKLGSLNKDDFRNFMKRFRKHYNGLDAVGKAKGGVHYPIRYFHCGEYGEQFSRPHHHACIFNFDFEDKELYSIRNNVPLYRSELLERLWSKEIDPRNSRCYDDEKLFESHGKYYAKLGYCTVGHVTFESAAYVARYVTKKMYGDKAKAHYAVVDEETGEIKGYREPEYCSMSRRPGIGRNWIEKFNKDIFTKDAFVHNGKTFSSPRYYDTVYERLHLEDFENVKRKRMSHALDNVQDKTVARRLSRHKVKLAQSKQLKRGFEHD